MRNLLIAGSTVVLALFVGSSAKAGIIYGTFSATQTSGSDSTWNGVGWGGTDLENDLLNGTTTSLASLQVIPSLSTDGMASDAFNFSGQVDSDPSIDLIEKITNTTTTDVWNSLEVNVTPQPGSTVTDLVGTTGDGSATQGFTSASTSSDGTTVTFYGGAVGPGKTAIVELTFNVGTTVYPGDFGYDIANTIIGVTAVPEPVSLASLAGAGCLLMLRRKR